MKIFPIFVFVLVGILFRCEAQYVTFSRTSNGTNEITVPNNQAWQVVNWYSYNPGTGGDYFSINSGPFNSAKISFGGTGTLRTLESPSNPVGLIITGPTTLTGGSYLSGPYDYYLVFKVLSSSGNTSSSVSATSVVIPTIAAGDVDIKLEQSADNVTWTECLPGTYNSSTVKRFFRLRAVEK